MYHVRKIRATHRTQSVNAAHARKVANASRWKPLLCDWTVCTFAYMNFQRVLLMLKRVDFVLKSCERRRVSPLPGRLCISHRANISDVCSLKYIVSGAMVNAGGSAIYCGYIMQNRHVCRGQGAPHIRFAVDQQVSKRNMFIVHI